MSGSGPYILKDADVFDAGVAVGGKAGALAMLNRRNLPIPSWFVVTPAAFETSLSAEGQAIWSAYHPGHREALFAAMQPSPDFLQALNQALDWLCPNGDPVAVRSSALDEDGAEHSFAGILESALFVHRNEVLTQIQAIWQSAFDERVWVYRKEHGLTLQPQAPAVIVQRMINADASGVAFSADPITGQRHVVVVSAVFGLGSAIVSGECNADTIYVGSDDRILHYRLAHKAVSHRTSSRGGVFVVRNTPGLAAQPTLSEEQAQRIARLVRATEAEFGHPQDIEWAMSHNELYLLQSRPITTLNADEPPGNPPTLCHWDNATTIESWGSPVTPLTASVANRLEGGMYRAMSRYTCLRKDPDANPEPLFSNLLGSFQGRLYLNTTQLNAVWHQTPSLEYRLSQLACEWSDTVARSRWGQLIPLSEWRRMLESAGECLRVLTGLACFHMLQPWHHRRFIAKVDALAKDVPRQLDRLDPQYLQKHRDRLLDVLDHHWKVPTLTNYLANHFYDAFGRLLARWYEGRYENPRPGMLTRLLSGESESISRDLTARLRRMAALAARDRGLLESLSRGELPERATSLNSQIRDYLARYGDRCQNDLSMESPSLLEDPTPLYHSIAALARLEPVLSPAENPEAQRKASLREIIQDWPWRQRLLFRLALHATRRQIAARERLRFEVTRLMETLRRLLKATGRSLSADGRLQTPDDILYLTLEEINALVDNPAQAASLQAAIHDRRQEHQRFLTLPPLPATFTTYGRLRFEEPVESFQPVDATQRRGMGCSPGEAEGLVLRVPPGEVPDPDQCHGRILMADHGDPGLVTVFPLVAGLLFERGNALSHTSIVARELGIPTVVAVPGLMQWLWDGDRVHLDGQSGLITRREPTLLPGEQQIDQAG